MNSYILGNGRYRTREGVQMVVIRTFRGEQYIKGGLSLLPADSRQDHIDQLIELGLVEEVAA